MDINTETQILNQLNQLETQIEQQFKDVHRKFDSLNQTITEVKVSQTALATDNSWIKWLLGGLLSFVLILLSIIITVQFKLISLI